MIPPGLINNSNYDASHEGVGKPKPPGLSASYRGNDPDPQDIENALIDFLSRKPNGMEKLTKLGVYLRGRRLVPPDGLKKFALSRPSNRFVYVELPNGDNKLQLIQGSSNLYLTNKPTSKSSPGAPDRYLPADDNELDEPRIEYALLAFMLDHAQDEPSTMPVLGELILRRLKISMKGRLRPFLKARPGYFDLSDDGRQHVRLVDAHRAATHVAAYESTHADAAPLRRTLSFGDDDYDDPGSFFAEDGYNGHSNTNGDVPDKAARIVVVVGGKEREMGSIGSAKWDPLTQVVFKYVRNKGGASFRDIDAYVKEYHPSLVEARGVPLYAWKSQVFLNKRRNIFKLQSAETSNEYRSSSSGPNHCSNGPSIHPRKLVPVPQRNLAANNNNNNNSAAPGGYEYTPSPRVGGGVGQASGETQDIRGVPPQSTNNTGDDEFAEAIRQEVMNQLASLPALGDIRKENLSLRAACLTLGREVLNLKAEISEVKKQVAAAKQTINHSSGLSGSSPHAHVSWQSDGDSLFVGGLGLQSVLDSKQRDHQVTLNDDMSDPFPDLDLGNAFLGSLELDVPVVQPHRQQQEQQQHKLALPPSEIAMVGGHDGSVWLNTVDRFRPATGESLTLPPMDTPCSFSCALSLDGDLYVAGGGDGARWYDKVIKTSRERSTWVHLAPLPVGRGSMAAALSGKHLYVFGGGKPGEQYSRVDYYDPHRDQWFQGPELAARRFAVSGGAIDGIIYAVGGFDGTSYLSSVERLDPREGRWTPVSSMTAKRGGHACTVAGNRLFSLGGFCQEALASCEVYDPKMGIWKPVSKMLECRAYGAAASVDGSVYAVGGLLSDMQTHAALLEKYDMVTDSWMRVDVPGMVNSKRSFLAACAF